ncbi:MAG: Ig domain-containing protein, partial [Planctomycetes bacterium]|nr:Ig domain-containing protein [Planctomycetota bacterium]
EQADQGGLFFEMVPYLVTVLVTDADGRTAEASIGFGVNPKVNVVTDFFPSAFTQTAYELKLEASGGVGKHTWSGLNVPEGLAVKEIVNVSTNLITNEQTIEKYWAVSGIPYYTLPSGVHTFQLIATDSSTSKATAQKTSYILIEEGVPFAALDTPVPSIPDRMVEQFPAAITLDASGGIEPYTWAATSELPAGFALSSNGSQCTIEGALTDDISEVTTYTISLSLTDSSAPQQTVDVSFDISIEPGLEIITSLSQLPSATAGKAYSYEFAAPVFTIIGGVTPFDYAQSIALSELPKGLSFATSANGNLTLKGTPALTAAANEPYEIHPFVISDDQANGIHEEAGAPLSLMVEPAKLTMLNSVLPAGIAGQPYAVTLQGFGGIAPLTWTASGLPAGVTLKHDISTDTYSLAGTLDIESVGPYVISLSLTDSATKPVQVTTKLALIVSEPDSVLPLSIGVSSLPVATEGEQYGPVTLSATGGNAPYAWGESIGLPTGLSIAALANGSYIITGVPQVGSAAIYSVKLTVADSTSPLPTKASGVYTLVVLPALQSSSPDVAIPGQTLSDQVIAGAAAAGCSIQSQCSHVWFVIMLSMLGALCVATRRHEEESSMELLP